MSLKLSSPIIELPYIGPAKAKLLSKLDITYVRDFLYTFPRRYDDFSQILPIAQLEPGEKQSVRGRVVSVKSNWGYQGRRRVLRINVDITDDTGTLKVTWYNLRFLPPQLWQGRELMVAGLVDPLKRPLKKNEKTLTFSMRSPVLEFVTEGGDTTHTARITPVYPETQGVTSRFIRYQVKRLLPLMQSIPEYLPVEIRDRYGLVGIHEAVTQVHFPESKDKLETASQRLRFDELFFLQLAALVRRQSLQHEKSFPIPKALEKMKKFIAELPFSLTGAQRRSVTDIVAGLTEERPMNRLLQGDVGSGKSVVALIATYLVLESGYTVLYLAPTEILARQQAESFQKSLGEDKVALLLGAHTAKEKTVVKARLASSEPLCVVGTHALLQADVKVQDCALVIIDEQHRFGVAQRRALQQVATDGKHPHLLSMTATPIPRTLSLTVYGDLDVSVVNELPPGRQAVRTEAVISADRERVMLHVLGQLHQGKQAYVIAPLVEESQKSEVKSAMAVVVEMRALFPGVAVGLLHGKLPSEEKEGVLRQFAAGALQLLVATSVVEVGINVPNATIMLIEGAERFGLAQLHQFRGRIGRGQDKSYCYLLPTDDSQVGSPRLQILTRTNDGFIIAEEDLRLRGPGEIYGVMQSGFGRLQVASLLDYATITKAREAAKNLLQQDSELKKYPILRAKVEQKNLQTHFE